MPRKPRNVKSSDKVVRVTLLLPVEDVQKIDEEARVRSLGDPYGRTLTRSDVIRSMITAALKPIPIPDV